MRPRIFVGSSGEARRLCDAIQQELQRDFDVTVWDQDVFRLTYDALDSLLAALDSSDAGVFVVRPDDVTESREQSSSTVRDNVIFELGMFIGRLGRDRTFMLSPKPSRNRPAVSLPSDLSGVTTAHYDEGRIYREPRAAVAPACSQIRQQLESAQLRVSPEPRFRERLDRAMRRMSTDLENLLADYGSSKNAADHLVEWPKAVSVQLARATICVEAGRIQDYQSADTREVVALPANEYFDDECITDTSSSVGAFVQHHFRDSLSDFITQVQEELNDVSSQRVPRAERRIDESYGIGEAILLRNLHPEHRLILVSATTERTGVGLRAEPHFLYAALESVIEKMNEHRLNQLVMPVFGSGHGGMPLPVALLFNLLAARSILSEERGRKIRRIRIIVFERSASAITPETMTGIISRLTQGTG
jgi:O-acetyl-ADP-ribose deacetylase (regulator of RNase III)